MNLCPLFLLPIYLPPSLLPYLTTYLPNYLLIYLPIYLNTYLYLLIHLSTYLSIPLPICIYLILRPISVLLKHMRVGMTTRKWAIYQKARPWRKCTLFPSAFVNCLYSLNHKRGFVSPSSSHPGMLSAVILCRQLQFLKVHGCIIPVMS